MKRPTLYLAILIALSGATLSAAPTAQAAEEKKPSWIERIFGTKETTKEVEEEAPKTVEKTATKDSEEASVESDKATPVSGKADKAKKNTKDLKFSKKDREVLEDWQKGNAGWKKSKKRLPPGLQKKVARGGELPPGWKKKMEIGTVLEPEIDKVARPLPEEILARLPDIPENTEIVRIGNEIVRVIENTREIVDILGDINLGDK